MAWHALSEKEVLQKLDSSKEGLHSQEAEKRLEQYGKNEITRKKKISALKIFIDQFKDFLIWILFAAAVVSGLLGEMADVVLISIILIANAILGFVQEYKAESSIEALRKMASLKAIVMRDGREQDIDATLLVPGDVVVLQEGMKVPADLRLLEVHNIETQEAALTGESVPVQKELVVVKEDSALGDRHNMMFKGTIITRGAGKAVIVDTGMKTELGKIAGMIEEAEVMLTPLQKKLDHFGKVLGVAVLVICAVVFGAGVLRGEEMWVMLLVAISLAVAAVPEGLPAVVTITLSIGVQRMIKRNALIRKLPSVETLGCCQVICADKTGTLTHNQMTVKKIFVDNQFITVAGEGYEPQGEFSKHTKDLEILLRIGALCNDAVVKKGEEIYEVIGDPTEGAILVSAMKAGIGKTAANAYPRIDEIPFDSKRKLMTTIHKDKNKTIAYTKGAVDKLVNICDRILIDGKVKKLSIADKKKIFEANDTLAKEALRVLAFAYGEKAEKNMVFVGLQGMIDPPRSEAIEAIENCHKAGIKVVMITGDHAITADAIGKKMGIEGKVITGVELDKLGDVEFEHEIDNISIYARVNPEHKLRIITTFQNKGLVTAMTGDGVNDAPALKKADIGVAMGITGTDVAKEASDMILTDDNFASLVNAIEEGRIVFDNIKKFVEFLLSCNLGEVLVITLAIVIGLPLPLIAVQILWMNLVTDGLPALALGMNPGDSGIMGRKPRKKGNTIVTKFGLARLILTGSIMTAGTLFMFMYGDPQNNLEYAQTLAFCTIIFFQLFQALNCRSLTESLFSVPVNKWLFVALASSVLLQLVVIYTPLSQYFGTIALGIGDWVMIISISSTVFILREIVKFVEHRLNI